ncbi:hypothetical protein K474DRAFT_1666561 [Panus rudis PR-1116 ss-1]|nr:hypothetical protein K474DRAFT_1666561 [Panus rudis PR-1116 ss-1]
MDGRAGPRSENVVLQKSTFALTSHYVHSSHLCSMSSLLPVLYRDRTKLTAYIHPHDLSYLHFHVPSIAIDHLNSLLTERAELVQRLANARARLAPGHPALAISPQHLDPERGVPLWEREWNGGSGWGVDADPEE